MLVPTREDVLAIRSIEEAFDLSTRKVRKREVALIRVASACKLLVFTEHAAAEADDEWISQPAILRVIETTKHMSKDIDRAGPRHIGINFDGTIRGPKYVRAKVTWDEGYLIATVHSVDVVD